jgi:hypothetical protein
MQSYAFYAFFNDEAFFAIISPNLNVLLDASQDASQVEL